MGRRLPAALALVAALVLGASTLLGCGSHGATTTLPTGEVSNAVTTPPSASSTAASSSTSSQPRTTSSIVPRADGTFMSLSPEEIASAVVEVKPAPDLQVVFSPLDLSGEGRNRLASLVNGLRLSSALNIEVVYFVGLHVKLVDGHEFYVLWFKEYPMIFKDFPQGPQGRMLVHETVESSEMASFLAEYGDLIKEDR
jgi:hypothetical protein